MDEQVQEVCALVCRRGARLTAAAIGGILFHLGRDPRANRAAVRRTKSIERGRDPAAVAGAAAAGVSVESVDGSVDLDAPRNVVAVEGAVLRHYVRALPS